MPRRNDHSNDGNVAVQLLMTLVILGTLAATSVIAFGGSKTKGTAHTSTSSCSSFAGCAHFALQQACKTDAKIVETATSAVDATSTSAISVEKVGSGVGQITLGRPATYSLGTQAQRLLHSGYITSWPGDSNGGAYSVSLSTTVAGDVAVHVPANAPGPGVDFESETSTSGCNSL